MCFPHSQHRTEVDIQNLQLSQNRLKQSLEQNERNLAQQQEKERQLISKNKVLASRLKMEKEEVSILDVSNLSEFSIIILSFG